MPDRIKSQTNENEIHERSSREDRKHLYHTRCVASTQQRHLNDDGRGDDEDIGADELRYKRHAKHVCAHAMHRVRRCRMPGVDYPGYTHFG